MPKQGSGSTNDGNTARTFFRNYKKVSEITGFDEQLLKRMYVLLQVMASGRYIITDRFRDYAKDTAELYVKSYPWYYMPVAFHVILFHGADIIERFLLPIGCMSEEAQESRNKDLKRTRTCHSRRGSRTEANQDIFNYLLVSSDPYITYCRKRTFRNKYLMLPEAVELLEENERLEYRVVSQPEVSSV